MTQLIVALPIAAFLAAGIAFHFYFYVPHSAEVHHMGKYGEVVTSAAIYVGACPTGQVWLFVMSVMGRWSATHPRADERINEDRELLLRSMAFLLVVFQLFALMGNAYFAVRLAFHFV